MNILKLTTCSFLLTFVINLNADISAPSSLDWLDSKQEMMRQGISVTDCKRLLDGAVEYCRLSDLTKPISFAEYYTGYFVRGYGLTKISITGKDITNDIYGTSGISQYNKLKNSLFNKYPEDQGYAYTSYEYTASKLYKESDEFYECLKYDGCGSRITYILTADDIPSKGTLSIELIGLSRGTGYMTLTYESSSWSEALDMAKSKQNEADEDAL